MNPTAIFSKTGKGVQEAAGKTSHLSRGDRAVLAAIDGKSTLGEVSRKFDKITDVKFRQLIQQLDKDGFIREVSAGAPQAAAPAARAGAGAARAPAPPPKDDSGGEELDFTQALKLPPKAPAAPAAPAAPKAPPVDLAAAARAEAERKAKEKEAIDFRTRQEAEARAKAEAEARAKAEAKAAAEARAKAEAEAKLRAEAEAKAKADADAKVKAAREAAERARKEAEEKAGREAEELRQRLDEERKAREDAERRAREEAERREKEEAERKAREAEERKRREEEEARRRAEEERRAKEEAERKRREAEERERREKEERRAREEAERKAREEDDRKRRESEERARREKEERRRKEDEERRAKQESDRRAREDEERERREKEAAERREKEEAAAKAEAPATPLAAGGIDDALLADLDSFTQREEEERKAREEADRKAKEEKKRRQKEAEEKAKQEEEEAERRAAEERRAREEAERRAKEEEEEREREAEMERRREDAERKRKAKELLSARPAEPAEDEIVAIKDDDLDLDEIRRDQKAFTSETRAAAREPEEVPKAAPAGAPRKQVNWGKAAAIVLFVMLVGGVGLLHVMGISTAEYEKAASEALGVPVKIGSGSLSLITGVEVRFERVAVGDSVKIARLRGSPDVGSLFGDRKSFSSIELEGIAVSQDQLGAALLGKVQGANLKVGRILVKQVKLDGPVKLPPLDVEIVIGGDGALQSIKLTGPEKLDATLTPRGAEIGFEARAGSLALPFVPALTLSDFGMKGSATRQGMNVTEFDGRTFDGVISGSSRIRWGSAWSAEGEVRARGLNVAVFAPTLLSEGKLVEARGTYSMSGPDPARLHESARIEGNFKVEKGVLGSFDLTRALQTGGSQATGRTLFSELNAQGVYDKRAVQLRNVTVSAGAMNAGASLDISADGALAGRIVADVKTPTQTLRATLNVGGKLQEPLVRK